MRLRNAPQPKLRLRNRLTITLFILAGGFIACLAVWVSTQQSHSFAGSQQRYPYPVTVSQSPLYGGVKEAMVSTGEIESLMLDLELVENGKGVDPQGRLKVMRMHKQLKLLKEIEDHEMRISMRALDADFDPEPYQSKVNILRARLREMEGVSNEQAAP